MSKEKIKGLFSSFDNSIVKITFKDGSVFFYNDNDKFKFCLNIDYFDNIPEGTYYREGYEPKKVLLSAEDIDKRNDLRILYTSNNHRLIIEQYNDKLLYIGGHWIDYIELANKYTWLDGDKCYKEDE